MNLPEGYLLQVLQEQFGPQIGASPKKIPARGRQSTRYAGEKKTLSNAQMLPKMVRKHCVISADGEKTAGERYHSARALRARSNLCIYDICSRPTKADSSTRN
jgi:hypothetical protein